ncbi:hypothetical protein BCR44DRAFT_1041266 [Catenaria anguillulae PL171]|uniref:Uncharacterized protein n=1 Tax=Catenaria anguillulae PL171 TaxID=765915 RepID=A0A1Y2HRE5_9FUNG|nr:hypothetical protein BCR44DRAFT_1041266 [Catenaria anguillulae PL171]
MFQDLTTSSPPPSHTHTHSSTSSRPSACLPRLCHPLALSSLPIRSSRSLLPAQPRPHGQSPPYRLNRRHPLPLIPLTLPAPPSRIHSFPIPIPNPVQAQPLTISVPGRSSSLYSRQSVISTASSAHMESVQHMRDYSHVSSGSGSSSGSSSTTGMQYGPRRSSLMYSGSRPMSAGGEVEQGQVPRVGPRSSSLSAAHSDSGMYFEANGSGVQQQSQGRREVRSSSHGEQIDGFVDCQMWLGLLPVRRACQATR